MHTLTHKHTHTYTHKFTGERTGALTFITGSPKETSAVESQLKIIIRPLYSNPPINGARIANEILTNPELYQEWLVMLEIMKNCRES